MTDLTEIANQLRAKAMRNLAKAWEELGAEPGPGIDIIIRPTVPVSNVYVLDGMTEAGKAFIDRFWPIGVSSANLYQFKLHAGEFGLAFTTDWSKSVETEL